jgi:hypothetical protein
MHIRYTQRYNLLLPPGRFGGHLPTLVNVHTDIFKVIKYDKNITVILISHASFPQLYTYDV